MDGGTTDNTIEILKEYPHIKWISEKDDGNSEALMKGISMAKGKYIIQCCTSDDFLYKDWFKKCVEVLDSDSEVSLVYGLPQYMTEEGLLGRITDVHFLTELSPQKRFFLAYWLNTGSVMFEGNQCVRKEVLVKCFPVNLKNCLHRDAIHHYFSYNFTIRGYLPYFVPVIADFGRTHKDARTQRYKERERERVPYLKDMLTKWIITGKCCFGGR